MPVQIFMAWRIWVLTGVIWPGLLITILAVVSFGNLSAFYESFFLLSIIAGGGVRTTVSVSKDPHFQSFKTFLAAPTLWLVTTAAADVMITASLVATLVRILSRCMHEYDA